MAYRKDDEAVIESLLETKSFTELTDEEKLLVIQVLGSEEEYHNLRKIGQALVGNKADLSPDPRVLLKVKNAYASKHQAEAWYSTIWRAQVPAYAMAIPLLVLSVMYFLMDHRDPIETQPITLIRRDTIVTKRIDTVFIERQVVRFVKEKSKTEYVVAKNDQPGETNVEGVSVKEKEELEQLLVSGS
jgi:hypothetical protein